MEKHTTALYQLITMLERHEPIMPETKQRLLDLEKLQLIQAYQLDPELMKIKYRNGQNWFKDTYLR